LTKDYKDEADDEAIAQHFNTGHQLGRYEVRASREERIDTSRFVKNGRDAMQSRTHKLVGEDDGEEESDDLRSSRLKPKHSEEPTWARRVRRSGLKTGGFRTPRDDVHARSAFRFIYPVKHLKELKRQSSPYSRSHSANVARRRQPKHNKHKSELSGLFGGRQNSSLADVLNSKGATAPRGEARAPHLLLALGNFNKKVLDRCQQKTNEQLEGKRG